MRRTVTVRRWNSRWQRPRRESQPIRPAGNLRQEYLRKNARSSSNWVVRGSGWSRSSTEDELASPAADFFSAFSWSYWIIMSWESNMIQHWCVSFLNHFARQRRSVQILPCVTLERPDVHRFFSLKTGMNLLIQLLTWSFFPANFMSFFLCLNGERSENLIRGQSSDHFWGLFE